MQGSHRSRTDTHRAPQRQGQTSNHASNELQYFGRRGEIWLYKLYHMPRGRGSGAPPRDPTTFPRRTGPPEANISLVLTRLCAVGGVGGDGRVRGACIFDLSKS
jgi:hypothetical protein